MELFSSSGNGSRRADGHNGQPVDDLDQWIKEHS
jgi:hypothetical protein